MESNELNINVTLFQGLPKFEKLEFIIEKTTELGVNSITPVEMKYSVAKMKNEEQKNVRWNKIAEAAAKQSKRDRIPQVNKCIKDKELIKEIQNYNLVLVCYEDENRTTLRDVLQDIDKSRVKNIAIIVGPEGGLDKSEVKEIIENGGKSVSLGKRILRTETAPLAILSMLVYEFEL